MIDDPNQYYYVNGKISTCRRCKRKRTLDEDPQHLQFKTCYRCRMIERDQKKFNQARRKLNADAYSGNRSTPPTHEEIAQLAEILKTNSKGPAVKPYATANMSVPDSVADISKYMAGAGAISAPDIKNGGGAQYMDPAMALLEGDLPEDQWDQNFDIHGNDQLFSFNILSIDPKLNPLTLSLEQQSLLQLSFLAKYQHDHANNLGVNSNSISSVDPRICFSCKIHLPHDRLAKQLCENCENKQSTLKEFNLFLTILKVNLTQDLYRVIFVTNIPVDQLVKSSLSNDRSKENILKLLYEKYVLQINEVSGAEFVLPSNINDDSSNDEERGLRETISPAATMTPTSVTSASTPTHFIAPQLTSSSAGIEHNSSTLKKILHCACDNSINSFAEAAIDPEALSLQNGNSGATSVAHSIECKFSQLSLSYDMISGDFVISFSHSCHH